MVKHVIVNSQSTHIEQNRNRKTQPSKESKRQNQSGRKKPQWIVQY